MGGCHISPGAGTVTVCLQPHLDVLAIEGEDSLIGDDRVLEEVQGNHTSDREVELLVVDVIDYHGFGGDGRDFGLELKSVKSGVLLLKARVLLLKALDLSRLLTQRLRLRAEAELDRHVPRPPGGRGTCRSSSASLRPLSWPPRAKTRVPPRG